MLAGSPTHACAAQLVDMQPDKKVVDNDAEDHATATMDKRPLLVTKERMGTPFVDQVTAMLDEIDAPASGEDVLAAQAKAGQLNTCDKL